MRKLIKKNVEFHGGFSGVYCEVVKSYFFKRVSKRFLLSLLIFLKVFTLLRILYAYLKKKQQVWIEY